MKTLQPSPLPLKSNSIENLLGDVISNVEKALDQILPQPTSNLNKAIRYSVLGGGKGFRSFLLWASSQLFTAPPSLVFKAAAALEIIHSYSLVHDDLPAMDNAETRRGKPSCHKVFGEETAILVGDALIPLAFETLSQLDTSYEIRLELIRKLARAIGPSGLVAGQMIDLGKEGLRFSFDEILEQQRLKTGVLFGFATEAGAILGHASSEEKEALKTYGLLIGQAFQMMDDWLDGCGNELVMGKPSKQDIKKVTFLSLLGPNLLIEKAESAIKKAIEVISIFQDKDPFLEDAAFFVINRER